MGKKLAAVAALGMILAATGCGVQQSTAAASASPTPTPPPADGGSYATVQALRDAYVKAGGSCPAFEETDKVTLAAQSGDCDSQRVLSTYVNSSDISTLIQNNKALDQDLGSNVNSSSWLVGENWVINAPDSKEVQAKLGGRLVTFGPAN